jgi:hypothetical protein
LTDTRAKFYKGVSDLEKLSEYNPPDASLEALARRLYPAMVAYFESDQGKWEFAEWQAKRDAKTAGREVEPEETLRLAA